MPKEQVRQRQVKFLVCLDVNTLTNKEKKLYNELDGESLRYMLPASLAYLHLKKHKEFTNLVKRMFSMNEYLSGIIDVLTLREIWRRHYNDGFGQRQEIIA